MLQSILSTIIVTEQMVRDRLKEQKPEKSAGPDGIHSRVVVETQEQLVRPLTIIFNKSLSEGVVPDSWKEAEVVPIFKKGKRDYLLLLNFITDSLLHTCAGKYDSCPNYKHYIKTLHY